MLQVVVRRSLGALCLCLAAAVATAQQFTPSPEQIQQFKSLSPAQQRQVAEAMGIDVEGVARDILGQSAQPNLQESPSNRAGANEGDQRALKDPSEQIPEEEPEAIAEEAPGTLRLFGMDLFRSSYSDMFRPPIDIPVPANYVLGPGDTVIIQLYGKENQSYSLVINREGQVQFPQIGPVSLAGLEFNQAQKVIDDIVREQMIGVRASVTMGALRTIRVFVLGEVAKPGSFTVGSLATMTNALFESGGITNVGSLRQVELKRGGKTVTKLDLYDLLLRGDTSKDARLLPGDVIFVPPIGPTVGVMGAVKRPAIYELTGQTTTAELMALAGGLKNTAHLPVSYLIRLDEFGEKTLINVDLSTDRGRRFSLRDGDTLSIAETLEFINNQITLAGHLKRPGARSHRQGLRFTDVVPSAFDLLPNPDIEMALIQRFSAATRRVEVILFSPSEAWAKPGSAADPPLQGFDVVHLFNYQDDRPKQLAEVVAQLQAQARYNERQKVISVVGSVRFPGQYPLADNMTTAQLIHLAGGLTESAFGTTGEITRYEIDENLQRVVMHINVDLTAPPLELIPGDTLQIKQIPLWKKKETVEVVGEVMFPGVYTILPGETMLDVLTRAGGLTPHAYPLGAVFSRKDLRDLEQQRLTELRSTLQSDLAAAVTTDASGRAQINEADAKLLLENLDNIRPLGRMVIDLQAVLDRPAAHDFQLEDGDRLTIPRYKPSVTVVGEVQYPTSHFYDDSLDALDYVQRSGGFKKQADKGRVYIVKANGSVLQPTGSAWFRNRSTSIQPGDTIVVPMETDRLDQLEVWARVTQIIYQAALGAVSIGRL